jgi:hypothetical protein
MTPVTIASGRHKTEGGNNPEDGSDPFCRLRCEGRQQPGAGGQPGSGGRAARLPVDGYRHERPDMTESVQNKKPAMSHLMTLVDMNFSLMNGIMGDGL